MDKKKILDHYDDFFRDFFTGFACLVQVDTGFGNIRVLQPGEIGTKLSTCNLNSLWTHEEIINTLEKTAERYYGDPMLYFLPTWEGGVEEFKSYATTRGYQYKANIPDMVVYKDKFTPVDYKDLIFEDVSSVQADQYTEIFARCFNPHPLRVMRVKYQIERPMNKVENKFTLVKNEQGVAIGVGAYAFNQNLAYYHMIGVLPEFRGKGFSKAIISFICERLFDQGYSAILTAVDLENKESVKAKQSIGAEHFADCELWVKV